ncbi:hypothetical protein Gotur_001189 [Gossypium turneri]
MLTVNDDEFWEGVSPVEFGELPALQDAVTVAGYPIGGDTISVTSGVVSRIEILSYIHGSTELLGLQIDAAINFGNSGGPAFNDKGNCVGIAFQSLRQDEVENIGYVIPTPVIQHFIQDYEKNEAYTGFPILGIEWQKMENPDLRKAMGMKPEQKGVRIRRVDPTAPESGVLKSSDIVLSFDGVDIANDGTVPFRHGERIGFSYLVSQKYAGDSSAIKVLRNSEILNFNIKLTSHRRLIPAHNKGRPPSYYIIAGFVFTTVSVPYLRSEYGKDYEYEAPVKLLDKLLHSMLQSPDEQLVVVSQVLVSDINIGYEDIVNTQIVVLRTKTAKAATPDILATHCIPSAINSPDSPIAPTLFPPSSRLVAVFPTAPPLELAVDPIGAQVVPAMDAVVKVFCIHTEPNFSMPWQRKRQYSSSSSGFVISGRRVLTNAHSVEHYTQVKVKKRGSDTKYLATVLSIGTECDIGVFSSYN